MLNSRTSAACALACALAATSLASTARAATVAPTDVSRGPASRASMRFDLGAAPARELHAVLYVYSLNASPNGVVVRAGARSVRSGPLRRRRWTSIDVTRLLGRSRVVSLQLSRARIVVTRRAMPRLMFGVPPAAPAPLPSPPVPVPPAPDLAPPPVTAPPVAHPTPDQPCGVTSTPPTWKHVVWIVLENHSYGQAMTTPATPFTNALAAKCGTAADMSAEARPSLPNYIAMTSGATQGITDDNAPAAHPLDVPSIFSLTGGDWRSPQESMPANCAQATSGMYAVKHNPAAYYTNIRGECDRLNVPLTDPVDVSAAFTLITPNMCNSTHDCGVQSGDAWLAKYVGQILAGPEYASGTTAVFVTWDEGSGDQHIPTLVVSPSTRPGTMDGTAYSHYSMLRATEEMLGLSPLLGGAATATSMRAGFDL